MIVWLFPQVAVKNTGPAKKRKKTARGPGSGHGKCKLTIEQVREIRRDACYYHARYFAVRFNVAAETVRAVMRGSTWVFKK